MRCACGKKAVIRYGLEGGTKVLNCRPCFEEWLESIWARMCLDNIERRHKPRTTARKKRNVVQKARKVQP